ncbi:MAG: sigma-70 family RNA polymerase sigma factor [Phycisphaerae bacterium]|nr:sigma-70 family RNA polymerase sigma factor [Phycisphaerae bacterium]
MRPGRNEVPETDRPASPEQQGEPDAQLVARALAGESAAFDELVRRYERPALAVAYRLLSQAQDAQEVVQDALLRAYRALSTLANPQIFGPWLLRIVSNLALNYRRSRARRPAVSLDADSRSEGDESDSLGQLLVSSQERPEQELMTGELADRIRQALDELPERQRLALVLFSIEQMPQKDVAEIIGCSVEAVKWHVFTARKKLKDKLSDLIGEA